MPSQEFTPSVPTLAALQDAPEALRALMQHLRFSPENGRIWLDNRRMLLVDAFSIGTLRRELIDSLGIEPARGLLTRMGYASGTRDADLAQRVRDAGEPYRESFLSGMSMSALEGVAMVEPLRVEMDVEAGVFYGEYPWRDSSEGEIHVTNYGVGPDSVCWTQVGYACGYASVFMGRPIIFREVQCCGMGHEVCRVIGKPLEQWDNGENDFKYLQSAPFVNRRVADMEPVVHTPERDKRAAKLPHATYKELVGVSPRFNAACHLLNRVAPTNATVSFLGESGVGKEMFSRALHSISRRSDGPFIPVNCAAIPDNLLESELRGGERRLYRRGNFAPGSFRNGQRRHAVLKRGR